MRFYLTVPKPFVNQEPERLDSPEQLTLELGNALDGSRRHELATELLERIEPDNARAPWLDEQARRRAHELLPDLDRPSPLPEPPPPGPDLDTGMDFGP